MGIVEGLNGNEKASMIISNYPHYLSVSNMVVCMVILQPIERLGQAGQIVKVAPGFARNCLMPNKLALPAIEKFVLLVQNQLKVISLIPLNFPDLQII